MTMPDEAVSEPQGQTPEERVAALEAELAAARAENQALVTEQHDEFTADVPAEPAQDLLPPAAELAGGVDQPAVFVQHQPEEVAQAPVVSATNESPVLQASAHAAAMQAHGVFGHLIRFMQAAQADIEKYVPASVLQDAEDFGRKFIREHL